MLGRSSSSLDANLAGHAAVRRPDVRPSGVFTQADGSLLHHFPGPYTLAIHYDPAALPSGVQEDDLQPRPISTAPPGSRSCPAPPAASLDTSAHIDHRRAEPHSNRLRHRFLWPAKTALLGGNGGGSGGGDGSTGAGGSSSSGSVAASAARWRRRIGQAPEPGRRRRIAGAGGSVDRRRSAGGSLRSDRLAVLAARLQRIDEAMLGAVSRQPWRSRSPHAQRTRTPPPSPRSCRSDVRHVPRRGSASRLVGAWTRHPSRQGPRVLEGEASPSAAPAFAARRPGA